MIEDGDNEGAAIYWGGSSPISSLNLDPERVCDTGIIIALIRIRLNHNYSLLQCTKTNSLNSLAITISLQALK